MVINQVLKTQYFEYFTEGKMLNKSDEMEKEQ